MRRRGSPGFVLAVLLATSSLASGHLVACVGDEAAPVSGDGDGGGAAETGTGGGDGSLEDGAMADAPFDAPVQVCTSGTFVVEDVPELNAGGESFGAHLTSDGRNVYFHRIFSADDWRIYRATRAGSSGAFGTPELVTDLARPLPSTVDAFPCPSADDSALFFQRTSGLDRDIYRAVRSGPVFGSAAKVSGLSSPDVIERTPFVTPDAVWLTFTPLEGGSASRLGRSPRLAGGGYGPVAPVDVGLGSDTQSDPVPSADGKTLFFSAAPAGVGLVVHVVKSAAPNGPFGPPARVDELFLPDSSTTPSFLSSDGCELWFSRLSISDGAVNAWRIHRARRSS